MKLKDFKWPELSEVDMVFSTLDTEKALLAEATARGYTGHDSKTGTKMFERLFYSGGRIRFKKSVDEKLAKDAWRYLSGYIRSWAPKHEHKTAVCAMILDEIAEVIE